MSLISRILGRKAAAEPEPAEETLPVADMLKAATTRGKESTTIDPYRGVPENLHIPQTRNLPGTNCYIGMVCGSVLGGAPTVESSICLMVRYGKYCEYHPGRSDVCCVQTGAFTTLDLMGRAQFLSGPFRSPAFFAIDEVASNLFKTSARFKTRPLWEGGTALDVASVCVASALSDIEGGRIDFPSHKGKCSPPIEQLKAAIGSWSPKVWPSLDLLAFAVCAEAVRRFAPKAPIEKYTTASGGWSIRRAAPQPDPSYLRRDPNLAARPKPESRETQEARRRGQVLLATNFEGAGDPDKGKDK